MSRQDQIVDDDEPDTCPLCIEELDLSDRGFRPCPCGYQICQFCYNHLKTQLNSLCPACRRPYDDKNIKFEAPSPEEVAKYKESKAQQDKKKAAARRQEAATRHADTQNRKHLAGIRVRRQNLVYVTGLRLNTSDPQLSEKLRGEQFFGQYGKIDKIVVNKPKDSRSMQPVGVYITYFEKDAAALCIEMVNGTQNAGGMIRADYGTTKYCSAFLRNEICSNKNCTFLHEVGEENESFTREGLSSLNAISSQSTHSQAPPQPPLNQPQPSSQQTSQPQPSATSQPMERQDSSHEPSSPVDSSDGSALPSTASWAREPLSRRPSQAQSFASASPVASNANPMPPVTESPVQEDREVSEGAGQQSTAQRQSTHKARRPVDANLQRLQKLLASDSVQYVFDDSGISFQDKELLKNLPPLFDPCGGAKRLVARNRDAERLRQEKDLQVASQALSSLEIEESAGGGSLQLGGEPEERHDLELTQSQQRGAVTSPSFGLERTLSPSSQGHGLDSRSPLPQQQQQYFAQQFKSNSPSALGLGQRPQGEPYPHASGHAHSRQSSRFSFANDTASATTSIKPVTSAKLMNQQSSMMPNAQGNQYIPLVQQNKSGTQLFSSGVQGPPPGLKATGTPPVSGGGMFGQGHGFATAGLGYSVNSTSRNTNDEMMRELLRNRGSSAGTGQTPEGGRLDLADPSILQARMHQAGSAGQGQYSAKGQGQGRSVFPSATRAAIQDDPFVGASNDRPLSTLWSPVEQDPSQLLPSGLSPASRQSKSPPYGQLFGRGPRLSNEDSELMPGLGVLVSPKLPVVAQIESTKAGVTSKDQNISFQKPTSPVDSKATPKLTGLEDASFPALPKSTAPKRVLDAKGKGKKNNESRKEEPVTGTESDYSNQVASDTKASKQDKQRQHLGKLDIPAAAISPMIHDSEIKPTFTTLSSKPSTPSQAHRELSSTPSTSSRPATPGQSSEAPLKRSTQPRTIRVLPTSKVESPGTQSGASTPPPSRAAHGPPLGGGKHASPEPSIASVNVPGTPLSDKIVDNASVTTDSVSRASSPPPMGNESAPGKPKSKSQQKKEKAERAKAAAEERKMPEKGPAPLDEAAVHEPIIGRKKKSKKPAAPATSTPTPELSRPTSPINQTRQLEEQQKVLPPAPVTVATPEPELPKEESQPLQEAEPEPAPSKPSRPLPALTISELESTGAIDLAQMDFFKPSMSLFNARHDITSADLLNIKTPHPLTPSELQALDAGEPIHRVGEDKRNSSRLLITPSRKCLPRLTAEMEDRYLQLETAIVESKPPFKYIHKRKEATQLLMTADDILKDMCATLARPPTTTTAAAAAAAAVSAAVTNDAAVYVGMPPSPGSIGPNVTSYGDDALAYLNQFILPPLPPRGETLADGTVASSATVHNATDRASSTPGLDDSTTSRSLPFVSRYLSGPPDKNTSSVLNSLGQNIATFAANGNVNVEPGIGAEALIESPTNTHSAITQALANAVSGVVNAAAAVTGASLGSLGHSTAAAAAMAGGLGSFMSLEEAEQALSAGKKEVETLEKKMAGLVRKNRRLAGLQ